MSKQTNIPQLRFTEFEGEWERKKLGEVVTNKSGKYNPEKENNPVKCIELEHLTTESGQLLGYIDGSNSGSIKNKFEIGDILFGKLRPYLKKYLQAHFDGVCSSEIWVLKGINISNEFLYRIVQTNSFIDLANQSTGSKMPRADWSVVEKGIFSFPSLPEQKRIASFFTVLDKKIAELKQKKNLLEQYKKGVMQKIFSQELRFKDEKGKEFPKWEKKKLGNVAEINPRSESLPDTFIYIDLESVVQGRLTKEDRINKSEAPSRAQRLLLKNDILFQMVRPYQKNNYFFDRDEKDFVASTGYAQIRTSGNSEFLFQFLHEETFVRKVIEKCTGTGYPAINSTDLSNIIISIPSEKEQNKIADFLAIVDDKLNRTENQLHQTQQYKKGLIQNMFV